VEEGLLAPVLLHKLTGYQPPYPFESPRFPGLKPRQQETNQISESQTRCNDFVVNTLVKATRDHIPIGTGDSLLMLFHHHA
jgi:hypothetical protein